jgi:Na+/melibiose symporter-like transporter
MFREFYYWAYKLVNVIKANNLPALNGYLLICLLQGFNIEALAGILNYFLKINMEKNTTICIGLSLAFILVVVNRFLLYNKLETIIKEFENITPGRRKRGQNYFLLYAILSIVIFFVVAANLVEYKP